MQANLTEARTDRAPIAILGVPFDNITIDGALALITEMVASGRSHYATTAGVDFLAQSLDEMELRRILFDAHLVLAGEKPVVWAAKILGNPLPEIIAVQNLMPRLLALAEQKGWRVFFLGGGEEKSALEKIQITFPKLKMAGAYSPPPQPLLEMNHADTLRRIREAKPDVLLVALGCPKQEKWISMNYRESGVPFTLGVGAGFDFAAPAGGSKHLWKFSRAILRQWRQLRARKSGKPTGEARVLPDPFGNFVIRAPDRLGAAEAEAFQGEWLRAVENSNVMFDLSDTVFADSTGIGILIRLRKRARELGWQFFLVAPRPPVESALKLMKLDDFFTVQASIASARILMESSSRAPAVTSGVQEKELQIRWTGEVTALNAVELGAYTESELSQITPGMEVVIDLSRVTFVDSTGIGLMVRFKKNLKRQNIGLKFANVAASVRNALRQTQLEEFLLGGN